MNIDNPTSNIANTVYTERMSIHLPLATAENPHVIRLLYLQPSSKGGPTQCILRSTDLDLYSKQNTNGPLTIPVTQPLQHTASLPPAYKALSYVWGDAGDTQPILVNGQTYHVTRNCHAALQSLRDETEEACLWVDAICINQSDDIEKSSQVAMMGNIYRRAEEVLVYLGSIPPDNAREKLAFSTIRALAAWNAPPENFEAFLSVFIRGTEAVESWEAVRSIFGHKWFERLWVHQEILLASKATVFGDCESFSWDLLGKAVETVRSVVQTIARSTFQQDSDNPDLVRYRSLVVPSNWGAVLTKHMFRQTFSKHQICNISNLAGTSAYNCFDPRDHVFALYGLSGDRFLHHIRPDYTKTLSEVYTSMAVFLIQSHSSLEILVFAGLASHDLHSMDKLPSWAMDWRINVLELGGMLHWCYKAGGPLRHAPIYSSKPQPCLQLRGIQVDRIILLDGQPPKQCIPLEDNIYQYITYLASLWKEHFSSYPFCSDGGETSIEQIIIRSLSVDQDVGGNRLTNDLAQFLSKNITTKTEDQAILSHPSKTFQDYRLAVEMALRPKFCFLTEKGYLGLGGRLVKEGDMVCVLPGCSIPLLIRIEEDHHVLIGECFVWGLMYGEVLEAAEEENRFQDFYLQ